MYSGGGSKVTGVTKFWTPRKSGCLSTAQLQPDGDSEKLIF